VEPFKSRITRATMHRASMHVCWVTATLALLFGTGAAKLQDGHPMFSKPQGASVNFRDIKDYDRARVPTRQPAAAGASADLREIDGNIWRFTYFFGQRVSLLQLQASYRAAFKEAGFDSLLDCSPIARCGAGMEALLKSQVIPKGQSYLTGNRDQEFLLVAKGLDQGRPSYAMAVGMQDTHEVLLYFQVATEQAVQNIVKVATADELVARLEASGSVTVSGVYFDTDQAVLKPESREALDQVATLMKAQDSLKIYVVGHTDDSGALAHNLELSEARARAVRQYLVSAGINDARLEAHGVGPLTPVASNRSDDGRAANRRVMIVERH